MYGLRLLSGKSWDPAVSSDFESVVINEEAVNVFQLGDSQSAVGQELILPFDTVRILDVVKNHHWNSMKAPYTSMIFMGVKIASNYISVRVEGDMHEQ